MGTGKWWLKLPDGARDRFIKRYTVAMNHVSSALTKECEDGLNSLPRKGTLEVDVLSNSFLCKVGSTFDFNFDLKDIREAVDEFYQDLGNLTVPIDVALQRARDSLAAKRPRSGGGIG